jgi:hypothetical protein
LLTLPQPGDCCVRWLSSGSSLMFRAPSRPRFSSAEYWRMQGWSSWKLLDDLPRISCIRIYLGILSRTLFTHPHAPRRIRARSCISGSGLLSGSRYLFSLRCGSRRARVNGDGYCIPHRSRPHISNSVSETHLNCISGMSQASGFGRPPSRLSLRMHLWLLAACSSPHNLWSAHWRGPHCRLCRLIIF